MEKTAYIAHLVIDRRDRQGHVNHGAVFPFPANLQVTDYTSKLDLIPNLLQFPHAVWRKQNSQALSDSFILAVAKNDLRPAVPRKYAVLHVRGEDSVTGILYEILDICLAFADLVIELGILQRHA